ncbi:uncharacterized protein LOC135104828 [Scylla paramamosain]|uniref:uncharacterized protein LOC135104828 n=1 Tax=Scylla paramamosain TaxID=85552 RepID=UPI003082CBF5
MWLKAVVVVVVMLVMPVSPRPYQAQKGSSKIESAVSESLRDIEAAFMGSARKIEDAIDEAIQEKVSEKSGNGKTQDSLVNNAAIIGEFNKKAFRNVLAKIFARKRASAMKAGVASAPGSPRDDTSTTTMDPLDEYCKEACEAGVGGPECDCPDHPIG